jgi:hypothetical protein
MIHIGLSLAGNVFVCHVFPSHFQTWCVVSATCRQHVGNMSSEMSPTWRHCMSARVSKRHDIWWHLTTCRQHLSGNGHLRTKHSDLTARPWRRAPLVHIMGYGGRTPSTQYISVTLTPWATRQCARSNASVHHSLSDFTILRVRFCMHDNLE